MHCQVQCPRSRHFSAEWHQSARSCLVRVAMGRVTVFVRQNCPFCERARTLLEEAVATVLEEQRAADAARPKSVFKPPPTPTLEVSATNGVLHVLGAVGIDIRPGCGRSMSNRVVDLRSPPRSRPSVHRVADPVP